MVGDLSLAEAKGLIDGAENAKFEFLWIRKPYKIICGTGIWRS